jgi:hypothetical protein
MFPLIDRIWVAYNERRLEWVGTVIVTALCVLCEVNYIIAMPFLVVKAFATIKEVSEAVYRTPAWSQVFPGFVKYGSKSIQH